MSNLNPFHEGELQAQKLTGEVEFAESNGVMISHKMMAGAVSFIRAQKMAVVSSRDKNGRRWASMLFGKAGFLEPSTDRRTLTISIDPSENDPKDPLSESLQTDTHVGVLIIELGTRRRLRVNGAAQRWPDALAISVEESYANCPKYITRREVHVQPADGTVKERPIARGKLLGKAQTSLLLSTDVLFLATGHPDGGADASHRGGNPGFVEVLDAQTLRIPDYSGNSLFNSLGNLLVDPHYGMLIPDFKNGRILQLTGTAKIIWSSQDDQNRTGGTHRFVEYHIDEWREAPLAAGVSENVLDYSPYNPR